MRSSKATQKVGRARPPGAPKHPQRKKLPHDRPLWTRPEDEVFFITVCCNPRHKNQLCRSQNSREIFDSVEFRNRNHIWYAHLVVLMPDHLHALISFPYEQPIRQIVSDWKRFLATKVKIQWQRDFFDHRLRKEESYREKADHIRANPIRAGLIAESDEWPYFWVADPQKDNTNSEYRTLCRGAPGGRALPLIAAAALLVTACRHDMMNEPRAKTFAQSDFFKDGASARLLPLNVVPRGQAQVNDALHTGLTNGVYVTQLPTKLTPQLLGRGQERLQAFCAECHGRVGDGNGMVVQRGFPVPPSYHLERLRNAPIGHFFDVMTNGYGAMFSYAAQVEPQDRWAIAAYIRALQLSQHANPNDLPPEVRNKLEAEWK